MDSYHHPHLPTRNTRDKTAAVVGATDTITMSDTLPGTEDDTAMATLDGQSLFMSMLNMGIGLVVAMCG